MVKHKYEFHIITAWENGQLWFWAGKDGWKRVGDDKPEKINSAHHYHEKGAANNAVRVLRQRQDHKGLCMKARVHPSANVLIKGAQGQDVLNWELLTGVEQYG